MEQRDGPDRFGKERSRRPNKGTLGKMCGESKNKIRNKSNVLIGRLSGGVKVQERTGGVFRI